MGSDQRTLSIKLGSVLRLKKELQLYQEEEQKEYEKVEKLKKEQADPYDIKYAEKILAESAAMVPDTQQRLKGALKDLQDFMEENEEELSELEEFRKAQEEISAVNGVLTSA